MLGSWSAFEFPGLTETNCELTSPATRRYNCIAWAAGEDRRWWWPDVWGIGYWPVQTRDQSLAGFVAAYQALGYEICMNESLEAGVEKIAIYAIEQPDGLKIPTHASRQLPDGSWTSKLGPLEDISHATVDALNGPAYGKPAVFMCRRI